MHLQTRMSESFLSGDNRHPVPLVLSETDGTACRTFILAVEARAAHIINDVHFCFSLTSEKLHATPVTFLCESDRQLILIGFSAVFK